MTTVEPIRKVEDIRKLERYFSKKDDERDLIWFTIGS